MLVVKNLPANTRDIRDQGSTPKSGRYPGGGPGNPLQDSCLESPMDRGAWWATVHRVAKNQTRLKQPSTHTHNKDRRPLGNDPLWCDHFHTILIDLIPFLFKLFPTVKEMKFKKKETNVTLQMKFQVPFCCWGFFSKWFWPSCWVPRKSRCWHADAWGLGRGWCPHLNTEGSGLEAPIGKSLELVPWRETTPEDFNVTPKRSSTGGTGTRLEAARHHIPASVLGFQFLLELCSSRPRAGGHTPSRPARGYQLTPPEPIIPHRLAARSWGKAPLIWFWDAQFSPDT